MSHIDVWMRVIDCLCDALCFSQRKAEVERHVSQKFKANLLSSASGRERCLLSLFAPWRHFWALAAFVSLRSNGLEMATADWS